MTPNPQPPDHLSESAREWWHDVLDSHFLEPHHLKLLQAACESWDRAQSAREAVAEHGVVTKGRYGQLVSNPACIVEKENRARSPAWLRSSTSTPNPEHPSKGGPMPPTRRATVSRRAELDFNELMELMCGPSPTVDDPDGEPVSEWGSDDERHADWERHKDVDPLLTARHREHRRGGVLWAEGVYGP